MKVSKAFTVYQTIDEYGRCGELVGLFGSKMAADVAAVGQGCWGSRGQVNEVSVIVEGQRAYLLQRPDPITMNIDLPKEQRRRIETARAKLSADERKLLGID
jgi:hypothetical protein